MFSFFLSGETSQEALLSQESGISSCQGGSKVRESEGAQGSLSNELLPSKRGPFPSEVKGGIPKK